MENERKRGVFLSYFSIILSTFLQLIYIPFLVKRLGASEYGLYSLVSSIIGYIAVLDLGFGDAVIQYTAQYREKGKIKEEKKLHGMFLVIYIVIGIIAFVCGLILTFNVNSIFGNSMSIVELEKMKVLMIILSINLSITFPFSIYSSIIKAYERFTFQKVLAIIHSILQPIIMIPLTLFGFKSISLTIVVTCLNIFVLLSNYFYCKMKLNINIKYYGFDKKVFKEISSYSFFIFLNVIVDKINWSTDQTVLGIVSGTFEVTIYSLASKLNEMFIKLSSAISGVLFPKITKMVAQNATDEELSNEFIKVGRLQHYIIFLMTSGLLLFGKNFFVLWLGKDYIRAYYVAIILILPLSIPLIQNLGISILQAKNIHRFRSIMYAICSLFNILWSIPLSIKYGAIGAAVGTALSLFIGPIVIINIYYYKKAGIDIIQFWKEIIHITIPTIIPIIVSIILIKLIHINIFIDFLLCGIVYTIGYCIVCYKFSFNDYERKLCNNVIRKFKLKKEN